MSEFDTGHPDGSGGGSFQPAIACIARYSTCGAVGFGVGSIFPFLGFFLPGPLGLIGMVFGFALGLRRLRTLAFLLLAGGMALGIGGAVGGVALVALSSTAHSFRGLAGIPIAGVIGGALLGAILLPAAHIESK